MSGEDIVIAQLRAELSRLAVENAALQAQIDEEPAQLKSIVVGVNDRETLIAEVARLRARLPSEAELEAFRFVCGREWPWDVDDYKDAAESWLARQEDDNG